MKVSKWNSKGGGMKKHGRSGVPHNHAITIQKAREANAELEEENRLKEKRKGKYYESLERLFGHPLL